MIEYTSCNQIEYIDDQTFANFHFSYRYFTDVLQMLQGVWIFLAFVVFNPSAREELEKVRIGRRGNVQVATNGDPASIPLQDDVDNRRN